MTRAHERFAVPPDELRRSLDPTSLPFDTTADVPPLSGTIGQPRALSAISFALDAGGRAHNLYVAGMPGSGRETSVLVAAREVAATRPVPRDWVYVNNFAQPDHPIAIPFTPGRGRGFARDLEELLREVQRALPRAFEHEDVDKQKHAIFREATNRRDEMLSGLHEYARERDYSVEMTTGGVVSVALLNGQPIPTEAFGKLPAEFRKQIEERGEEVQARVGETMRQLRQVENGVAERIRQLEHDVVMFTVGPLFDELRERYAEQEKATTFLSAVQSEIPEHLPDFLPQDSSNNNGLLGEQISQARQDRLAHYTVNTFIDNSDTSGAPVVLERNPTYANLIGRTDYRAIFGAMVTDFRNIKPGALHRANGGTLVVHAIELLRNPFAWEALKRSLISGEVEIENLVEQYAAIPTARLRPEAIPLDVKVVLIGSREVYQALYHLDEDFRELFAVRADFSPDMPWNDEHVGDYAAFISRQARDTNLLHFDRGAVARVVEESARLRDHQSRLSARLLDIGNVVIEASYWASKAGHERVLAEDVDRAIEQKNYRANLIEERYQELIEEGTLTIATTGERVGQVNGLAIANLGDYVFGIPTRISARTSLGSGDVKSIDREIELSGPIHSKGFLTLVGYLQAQYAQEWPLAMSATITFEQSYDEVEGDSASSTELYALLSGLSGIPISQGIAVTGSVDQQGDVQAVGGVTRKIEGFFAICSARGLTGDQGVIIPRANMQHLMLAPNVIDAVRKGQFHIWAVDHIDQGIELLTGKTAGTRTQAGRFRKGSVHALVEDRLQRYAEMARTFSTQATATEPAGKRAPVRKGRSTPTVPGRQD